MSKSIDFKYSVNTLEEYTQILQSYTSDELNRHAIDVGFVPREPKDTLMAELEDNFTKVAKRTDRKQARIMHKVNLSDLTPSSLPFLKRKSAVKVNDLQTVATPQTICPLPAWRTLVNKMISDDITYEKSFPTQELEIFLNLKRDDPSFAFAMSHIRKVLLAKGMYLTSRGMKGECFIVLPAARNAEVMSAYSRRASDMLTNGIMLGSTTIKDTMTDEEKRRHDSVLEKLAHKAVLLRRSENIWSKLSKEEGGKKLLDVVEI